jgi:hypothetical protein
MSVGSTPTDTGNYKRNCKLTAFCGEYRIRTDDLLTASQAL